MAIAVDLDGTLAIYKGWNGGQIGEPIALMVARVRAWLAEGKTVKIFTSRVAVNGAYSLESHAVADENFAEDQRAQIQDWCEQRLGARLEVTAIKGFDFSEFWDDRAVAVIVNTGEPVGGTPTYVDALIYVPGEYECSVCHCHISKRTIDAQTGMVGISQIPEPEMCPNGCKQMSRVMWKDHAVRLQAFLENSFPTPTVA